MIASAGEKSRLESKVERPEKRISNNVLHRETPAMHLTVGEIITRLEGNVKRGEFAAETKRRLLKEKAQSLIREEKLWRKSAGIQETKMSSTTEFGSNRERSKEDHLQDIEYHASGKSFEKRKNFRLERQCSGFGCCCRLISMWPN